MNGKAIPFVEVHDDQFRINEEAVEFIETLPQPLAIIACAGGYRTGKSLFLNRGLLQLKDGKGFAVGNSTNACTKGLWIHTSLLKVAHKKEGGEEKDYVNVLFIDTEGLGAFDANDTHDAKIFALALLLCSYFVYNSVGKIDEDSIGKLSLVCNVCKQIKASANATTQDSSGEKEEEPSKKRKRDEDLSANALSEYFPRFLWLLRDFSLMLQDAEGSTISSKQYLENALADKVLTKKDGDVQKSIEEKNQLRKMLRTLFVQRDCATLMRPCVEESQLQKLDVLGDAALRPEFLQQMQALRRKILLDAPTKLALENRPISGRGLVQLCRSYVDAFNRGAAPVIRDSWNLLVEVQCRDAIDAAKSAFSTSLATLFQQKTPEQFKGMSRVKLDQTIGALVEGTDQENFCLQIAPPVLEQLLEGAFQSAVQNYVNICGAQNDEYKKKLEGMLDKMASRVRQTNARGLDQIVKKVADDCFQRVFTVLSAQSKQQSRDKVKPLWPQLLVKVEEAIHESLSTQFEVEDILINMIQRTLRQKYEQWVPLVEEYWTMTLKQSSEQLLQYTAQAEMLLQQSVSKLELQKEACEMHLRENQEFKTVLDSERKINAEQKTSFEQALQKQIVESEETVQRVQADYIAIEKELKELQQQCDTAVQEAQKQLVDLRSENASITAQKESALSTANNFGKQVADLSYSMDQMHEENQSLQERIKIADQTVSRLRTCEADLQQSKQELARVTTEFSSQLAQLEQESVKSLSKIRSTNEKTRKEQADRIADLEEQQNILLSTNAETRKTLEAQVVSATEKIVILKNEAKQSAERTAVEIQQLRDRIQAADQSLVDAQEQNKKSTQALVQRYEQEAKQSAQTIREEAKRVVLERNELQRKLNDATTDAACQRVRNEHLQSKLQDESSKGELLQAKKDIERVGQINEKLRAENEKLLLQQRTHQHELQDCERRVEVAVKKLQEQEREFSAERLRMRLRIEEENAQQAYRSSLNSGGTTTDDKKKK